MEATYDQLRIARQRANERQRPIAIVRERDNPDLGGFFTMLADEIDWEFIGPDHVVVEIVHPEL